MAPSPVVPAPLLQEQRRVVRDRIEHAAWTVLRERGLTATADEVAAEAGLSIRTVFRHYGTRDHMIATVLRAQLEHYGDTLPRPGKGASVQEWLPALLVEVHRLNATLGRAYWELAAQGDMLEGELADVAARRR